MNFLVSLGMLPFLVLQAIALILLIVSWATARRTGGTLPALIAVTAVVVGISTLLAAAATFQEKTGQSLGVSGGIASDAHGWLKQHPQRPANRPEVGDNFRTLNDAVTFLQTHKGQLSPANLAKLEELTRIPERPKRLLSVSEETQYLQSAQTGYDAISEIAGAASKQ